nr:hypothetical protein [Tanacetum cinerariifolium]
MIKKRTRKSWLKVSVAGHIVSVVGTKLVLLAHLYVPKLEHPEYHAPSDDDIQVKDQPHVDDTSQTTESPGYIADLDSMGEDNDEDPEEDPKEPSEGFDETKPFKEDKTAVIPPPPRHREARISVRPQTPIAASTQALIDAFATGSPLFPLPPTSPAYDQAPLGHRTAMIRKRDDILEDDILEEDMPPRKRFVFTAPPPGCDEAESSAAARAPRGQCDFVDTIKAGQGLIHSPSHDARTIARANDRAKDVGYVRDLQAIKQRMMTSIEEVNLRISYQA